ncbi:hypothetical protein V1511DRAFT_464422, partial [Dipodascopsis uninucleata]
HFKPNQTQIQRGRLFKVSARSPFISLLKHAKRELPAKNKPLILLGTNKAIEKTLSLGLRFREMGYNVSVETETITVEEEVELNDPGKRWSLQQRPMSQIRVTISSEKEELS